MLSRTQSILLSAVACLWACGVTTQANTLPATAIVQHLEGSATYTDPSGTVHPATQGTILHAGDTLNTGIRSSADLLLPETGATVGLSANAQLAFERLTFTDTDTGRVTDTLLDLQAGDLVSKVDKQKAGSQFLVTTDKATTSVRGTEFFVNSDSGDVHVTSGTVVVYITVEVQEGRPKYGRRWKGYKKDKDERDDGYRGHDDDDDDDYDDGSINSTLMHRVTVTAGQSLEIPRVLTDRNPLEDLAPVQTPWNRCGSFVSWLNRHCSRFEQYQFEGSDQVVISETFQGQRRANGAIWLIRPPEVEVVSY